MQLEAATTTEVVGGGNDDNNSNVCAVDTEQWTILISRFLSDQHLLTKVSIFIWHCVRRKLGNNLSLCILQEILNS